MAFVRHLLSGHFLPQHFATGAVNTCHQKTIVDTRRFRLGIRTFGRRCFCLAIGLFCRQDKDLIAPNDGRG